jgi:hypothetical protein
VLPKKLALIAADRLKNTRGVHPNQKDRLQLIEKAYGAGWLEKDFADWCEDARVENRNYPYPISEYLKVVDARYRTGEVKSGIVDADDPNITAVAARVYELTGRTPSKFEVQAYLEKNSAADIIAAFEEYFSGLDEREQKYAVRNAFHEGGLAAVLAIRVKRVTQVIEPETVPTSVAAAMRAFDEKKNQSVEDEEINDAI